MAKNLRKNLLFILIFLFLLSACNNKKDKKSVSEEGELKVSLLMDRFGNKDESINSKSYQGLLNLNVDTSVQIDYEVSRFDDFDDSIDKLIKRGSKLIWGSGYQTSEAIKKASRDNKKIHFATIDNMFDDSTMPKNLTGTIFNTEQSSYLLGYLAGLSTKTNRLAYLGGQRGVISDKNEYGFRAGVFDASKERKTKIQVSVVYIDTYSDKDKGRSAAKDLYESGVDIIFADCGYSTMGAIESAKEFKKFMMVTEEALIKQAPDNVILSFVKKYDEAINMISSKFISKNEIGGQNFELDLKNNCLDISPLNKDKKLIDLKAYEKTQTKKNDIIANKKIVPYNKVTFEKFSSTK